MARWKAALAWASAAGMVVTGAMGLAGCSSSNSAGGGPDATADALPPLGVGQPNCTPDVCPKPATCAGTLLGPKLPVSYCTIVCAHNSDCPHGDTCVPRGLGQCLATCTTNTDCSGGFACVDGGYCFSPYTGADAVSDAQAAVDGQADAGSHNEASTTDAGGQDAGGGDGSSTADGAPDAGASSDAAADAAVDGSGE